MWHMYIPLILDSHVYLMILILLITERRPCQKEKRKDKRNKKE